MKLDKLRKEADKLINKIVKAVDFETILDELENWELIENYLEDDFREKYQYIAIDELEEHFNWLNFSVWDITRQLKNLNADDEYFRIDWYGNLEEIDLEFAKDQAVDAIDEMVLTEAELIKEEGQNG